jgi:UDP-N-acetylglucosamine 2-epimerase (non-hydrolysing)
MKLMTIVGTRPELIRLSEIIKKADKYFNHIFVHTGQNYDANLNDIFYDDLNLRKPDHYLSAVGDNLGQTVGNIIAKSYELMFELNPDALLVLGDTNSCLSALSAKRLKIPVFHMEAGNRCFDENVPEEINRRIVDHISDIHLPYTEHARRNLLIEGVHSQYIFVTGSPMKEVIETNKDKIEASGVLDLLQVTPKQYIVLSAHREENIDNPAVFENLINAINALAEQYRFPVIYSVHPRSAKRIKESGVKFNTLVRKLLPFKFTDYSKLIKNAFCVVSDSGTLSEEADIHRIPAVSIRTSTERPEGIDAGVFILGGIDRVSMLSSLKQIVAMFNNGYMGEIVTDYDTVNVSDKVLNIIRGYTPVVNRNVWGKSY